MKKYLDIATTKSTQHLVSEPWQMVDLYQDIEGAQLAAIVIANNDETAKKRAEFIKDESGLAIPIVEVAAKSADKEVKEQIINVAEKYQEKMVPQFLTDLINFADEKPTSFTTPGHHNGKFYMRHPAGMVFKRFFGDNLLFADVSDTVPELGDTLTHGGTPLVAEKKAAQAFNADKVYFCTNGTTSANTICANALLTEDDLVLFDRNNHKSLYNSALVMTGAKPIYVQTDRNALGLIGPVNAADFSEAKLRGKIAKIDPKRAQAKRPFRLAVLQLETYDGTFYNAKWLLDKVGKLCDYVLFDCAWGGYEQFVELMSALSPLQYQYGPEDPGILVTQSIHKQQAGLAQTSQILKKDAHLKGQKRYVDHKHFNNAYLKYVTTSYSYPIYASLAVNAYMADSSVNKSWWEQTLRLGIEFRKKMLQQCTLFKPFVPRTVKGVKWEEIETNKLAHDRNFWKLEPKQSWHGYRHSAENEAILSPLKLTILSPGVDVSTGQYTPNGIPSPIIGAYLTERRIIAGKADLYSTLFLLTPGEMKYDLQTLLDAFLDFEEYYKNDAPLKDVMPRLAQKFAKRYAGYTLRKLCQEMHEYYREHNTYHLQQKLFLKPNMEDYRLTPAQADRQFMRNEGHLVDLSEILGKTALEGALPYPPGVFIVAPGERWQQVDIDYFKVLLGAMEKFPGFDPEIQGVYLDRQADGSFRGQAFVLD